MSATSYLRFRCPSCGSSITLPPKASFQFCNCGNSLDEPLREDSQGAERGQRPPREQNYLCLRRESGSGCEETYHIFAPDMDVTLGRHEDNDIQLLCPREYNGGCVSRYRHFILSLNTEGVATASVNGDARKVSLFDSDSGVSEEIDLFPRRTQVKTGSWLRVNETRKEMDIFLKGEPRRGDKGKCCYLKVEQSSLAQQGKTVRKHYILLSSDLDIGGESRFAVYVPKTEAHLVLYHMDGVFHLKNRKKNCTVLLDDTEMTQDALLTETGRIRSGAMEITYRADFRERKAGETV